MSVNKNIKASCEPNAYIKYLHTIILAFLIGAFVCTIMQFMHPISVFADVDDGGEDSSNVFMDVSWCAFVPDAEVIAQNPIMQAYCSANGLSMGDVMRAFVADDDGEDAQDDGYDKFSANYVGSFDDVDNIFSDSNIEIRNNATYKYAYDRLDNGEEAEYQELLQASGMSFKDEGYWYLITDGALA